MEATKTPATVQSLCENFLALGLKSGDIAIVHSSLSALGWVAGGAQAVVEALMTSLGPEGTLVMPTQTGQLTDPATWSNPPVPASWVETLRSHTPAFDPEATPSRGMGKVVDAFLLHSATRRSSHPTVSFAARGQCAEALVCSHALVPELGETSPLGRLYELDAKVLLLGVNHSCNTSLHLSEYRASWPGKRRKNAGTSVLREGRRQWVAYTDLAGSTDDFEQIGRDFSRTGQESLGAVGQGQGRLSRQRAVVDFGTQWMSANRK